MNRPAILVVEEDTIHRETVALALTQAGFEVVLADTGAEALSLLEDGIPFAGCPVISMVGPSARNFMQGGPTNRSSMRRPGSILPRRCSIIQGSFFESPYGRATSRSRSRCDPLRGGVAAFPVWETIQTDGQLSTSPSRPAGTSPPS